MHFSQVEQEAHLCGMCSWGRPCAQYKPEKAVLKTSVWLVHRTLKIRTDGSQSWIRVFECVEFLTLWHLLYAVTRIKSDSAKAMKFGSYTQKWIIYTFQITGSWWRLYPTKYVTFNPVNTKPISWRYWLNVYSWCCMWVHQLTLVRLLMWLTSLVDGVSVHLTLIVWMCNLRTNSVRLAIKHLRLLKVETVYQRTWRHHQFCQPSACISKHTYFVFPILICTYNKSIVLNCNI